MDFGIPQIIYLALTFMGLGIALVKHGETKDGNHNFWGTLIGSVIILWILYCGGFFS